MDQAVFTIKQGLVAGAALMILGIAAPARAEEPLPPGSYLETCRHAEVHRGMLMADCLRTDGTVNRSAIDLDHCHGGIANINGQLVCRREHHDHDDDRGPPPYGR